jgi:hypothetical protein
VHSNAGSAFERTSVTCQPINRTLGPFVRELYFWACFLEQFASVGPALPFSLYLITLFNINASFSFIYASFAYGRLDPQLRLRM